MDLEQAMARIAELEGVVSAKDDELMQKDTKIKQMEDQSRDQALNFKKLRDMTAEEKELLSEKEKELILRQEKFEEQMAEKAKLDEEFKLKQRSEFIDKRINEIAKGDPKIADEIKVHLNKFKDVDTAFLETELNPFIEMATKMVDIPKVDPLNNAHNQGGYTGEFSREDNFAETQEGKAIAQSLGLSQATDEK